MSKIVNIVGRQILDSRGLPTVEVDVILNSGAFGRVSVPAGVSFSKYEALEVRDGNNKLYLGNSVLQAISNINNNIKNCLINMDACDQRLIDHTLIDLDGTSNKSNLGVNSILAVSLACIRASAANVQKPLYRYLMNSKKYIMPVPIINVINGRKCFNIKNLDIQEFMIIPLGFSCFSDAIRCSVEIFHVLKKVIVESGYIVLGIDNLGGYVTNITSSKIAIEIIMKAIEISGHKIFTEFRIGLDISGNTLYNDGKYIFESEKKTFTSIEFVTYLENLVNKYPILLIEDAMADSDYLGWQNLTKRLNNKIQLVGDNLFMTNKKILHNYIKKGIANATLVKFNQVGTLTEVFDIMSIASEYNYAAIIANRSGETSDSFVSDFAVATGIGQIKIGSLCRFEMISKYNQLLRIEEELNNNCVYPGIKAFNLNRL